MDLILYERVDVEKLQELIEEEEFELDRKKTQSEYAHRDEIDLQKNNLLYQSQTMSGLSEEE